VAVVAVAARGKGDKAGLPAPDKERAPVAAPLPSPVRHPEGRVHVLVDGDGAERARILLDGKVVADGAREARVTGVPSGKPHLLRVEVSGRPAVERAFEVAPGGDVELAISLARAASPPSRAPGVRAPRREREATPATSPPPGGDKRHRDGLVGDDIFDKK
jgi:hypothetical protein